MKIETEKTTIMKKSGRKMEAERWNWILFSCPHVSASIPAFFSAVLWSNLFAGREEIFGPLNADFADTADMVSVYPRTRYPRLNLELQPSLAEMDARFPEMDARFGEMNAVFSEMDARFAEMKARFGEMKTALNLADSGRHPENIVKARKLSRSGEFFASPYCLPGRLWRCSAGFPTCCIADVQVGRASETAEGNGIRNIRRFRNLRYFSSPSHSVFHPAGQVTLSNAE